MAGLSLPLLFTEHPLKRGSRDMTPPMHTVILPYPANPNEGAYSENPWVCSEELCGQIFDIIVKITKPSS